MFTEVSVLISLQSACDLTEKSLNVWIQKTKQYKKFKLMYVSLTLLLNATREAAAA